MLTESITTRNPATGEVLKVYPISSTSEAEQIVTKAHAAYLKWSALSLSERKAAIVKFGKRIEAGAEDLAHVITLEMGKPIKEARAEVNNVLKIIEHCVNQAENWLKTVKIEDTSSKIQLVREPMGVIFTLVPWNFPASLTARSAIPNLLAGNAVVLRVADGVTGTGLMLTELASSCGLPENLFTSLVINNEIAAKVIAHPQVVGVDLTGSEKAGISVAATAGQHLKKLVLELGGSDAHIILADADLKLAAKSYVSMRLYNAGQICNSPKRLIVLKEIYPAFQQELLAVLEKLPTGFQNPLSESCTFGPLARTDLREHLQEQLDISVERGAKVLFGGKIPAGKGAYYPPTLIVDVKQGMPAYEEELFGPVISLLPVDDEQQALSVANDNKYGLSSGVFTQDLNKAYQIARKLQAGRCLINNPSVAFNAEVPAGGIKASGYGRAYGKEGMLEFTNLKSIYEPL